MSPVSKDDYSALPESPVLFNTDTNTATVTLTVDKPTVWYEISFDVPDGVTKVEITIGDHTVSYTMFTFMDSIIFSHNKQLQI